MAPADDDGAPAAARPGERARAFYRSGTYWAHRMDMMYYHYVDYIVRTVAREARSLIDVGTANCPYLELFDWIPERISFDIEPPYSSEAVTGLQGDFLTHDFARRFDVATCLQVLEHVPDPGPFGRRLLGLADIVIVSVPHRWPPTAADEHLHDPIDSAKLRGWMGRRPNYEVVVQEPFRSRVGQRLIALYHSDPGRGFGRKDFKERVRRDRLGMQGGVAGTLRRTAAP